MEGIRSPPVDVLTDVDVREPDEVGCFRVQEDVVCGPVTKEMFNLKPRVSPIETEGSLQSDELREEERTYACVIRRKEPSMRI